MRRLFRRETFIALRARREAHQIANEIVNPPMERPIPELQPSGPDEEYLEQFQEGIPLHRIPYETPSFIESNRAAPRFEENWIIVTKALLHLFVCIAALFFFLWLAASISAHKGGVTP